VSKKMEIRIVSKRKFYSVAIFVSFLVIGCSAQLETSTTVDRREKQTVLEPNQGNEVSTVPLKLNNPNCLDPDLAKVAKGTRLMLCNGEFAEGTFSQPETCSESVVEDCVVSGSFVSIAKSTLQPDKILAGHTVGSITGVALPKPGPCSQDSQQGCVVDTDSKFVAIDPSKIDPFQLKAGSSVAGVAGKVKHCKSGINKDRWNLETPNNTGTPDAFGNFDYFDSIEDKNDIVGDQTLGGPLTESAFDAELYLCKGDEWRPLAPAPNNNSVVVGNDSHCDEATDECMLQDQMTGIIWSKINPDSGALTDTWAGAITRCNNLVFGGYDDWRLPTLKEAQQGSINNVFAAHYRFNEFGPYQPLQYWTATTHSSQLARGYVIWLDDGDVNFILKTGSHRFHCIRDPL